MILPSRVLSPHHVVLVTYGEPPFPDFGQQLIYSWRILLGLTRSVAPIPMAWLPVIALARARRRSRTWRDEGYRSPLEAITVRQAARLGQSLATGRADRWSVHVGYEFRHPLLPEVLGALPPDQPAWVLPMYATESAFTHALSRVVVANLRKPRVAPVHVVPALDPGRLADASARHVLDHVAAQAEWCGPEVALVLAAHGTVLDPPRPIDTGFDATDYLCRAIRSRLAPHFGLVVSGWLNHTRGGRWTEPPIDETLRKVVGAGFGRVVYYPYGFLADSAETELEGMMALRGRRELQSLRVPCLNDSPLLADLLADRLLTRAYLDAVREPA
ncbi:MAG: ferrochelatase [Acidobacteriota bacterium]